MMIGLRPRRVYTFIDSWVALAAIAAAIRCPPGNAPRAPIRPAFVKKLRRLDCEKIDIDRSLVANGLV